MKISVCAVLAIILNLSLNSAFAAEEDGPWSGKVGLGYLATSGNTENKSFNLEFEVNYDAAKWHHGLGGRVFSAEADNDTTAENYRLNWKSQYDFTEFNYGFGRLDWVKDRFSSYDYQRFAAAGYGRRIIKTEKHLLNAEIGAGWQQSEPFVGDKISEAILRLGGDYKWNITETSAFSQTLKISAGSSNTFTEAVSELSLTIYKMLALGLSFTYQHNSDVVPGSKKTDTQTAINLNYEF